MDIKSEDGRLKIIQFGREIYSGRMYTDGEQWGCGVSTAMDVYCPVERANWFKNTSRADIEVKGGGAANMGTDLHKIVETAEVPDREDKAELQTWLEDYKKEDQKHSVIREKSEFAVFSQTFLYGGRVDLLEEYDGKRYITDLKTGRYNHSDLWKTEAYRQAYIEMTGDQEVGTAVRYMPSPANQKKGQKPRRYSVERHLNCFETFLSCYRAFRMTYYKELIEAGMDKERVFDPLTFMLYEREYGSGMNKDGLGACK